MFWNREPGKSVNIWKDRWLLNKGGGKVQTRKPQNCNIQTVQQLISGHKWNEKLLKELFEEADREEIRKIPFCGEGKTEYVGHIQIMGNIV